MIKRSGVQEVEIKETTENMKWSNNHHHNKQKNISKS